MSVYLKVWGRHAFFRIPGVPSNKSLKMLTPITARSILESIYFKPAFVWRIEEISILNPVKFEQVNHNSLGNIYMLKDVCYVIKASICLTHKKSEREDNDPKVSTLKKHYSIFTRRARENKPHKKPFFGFSDCPVSYEILEGNSIYLKENKPILETIVESSFPVFMDYNLNIPLVYDVSFKDGVFDMYNFIVNLIFDSEREGDDHVH